MALRDVSCPPQSLRFHVSIVSIYLHLSSQERRTDATSPARSIDKNAVPNFQASRSSMHMEQSRAKGMMRRSERCDECSGFKVKPLGPSKKYESGHERSPMDHLLHAIMVLPCEGTASPYQQLAASTSCSATRACGERVAATGLNLAHLTVLQQRVSKKVLYPFA